MSDIDNRLKYLQGPRVLLSPGTAGKDITKLSQLFEHLQLVSVDADPYEDLFTFVDRTVYFAAIFKDPIQPAPASPPVQPRRRRHAPRQPADSDDNDYRSLFVARQAVQFAPPHTAVANQLVPVPAPPRYAFQTQRVTAPSLYQQDSARQNDLTNPVGIIYLTLTHSILPLGAGELNIGVFIEEGFRGCGYAEEAVQLLVQHAVDNLNGHRIQAMLIDGYSKKPALSLFTKLHFAHEGIRRRAFYSEVEGEWKDVTCLAILATDWVMRAYMQAPPLTLWDELLMRHQREREELVRLDEDAKRLHRSSSMETIRYVPDSEPGSAVASSSESEIKPEPEVVPFPTWVDPFRSDPNVDQTDKGKRKLEEDESHWELSDSDDFIDDQRSSRGPSAKQRRLLQAALAECEDIVIDHRSPSPTPSHYSTASSVPTSEVSEDSQWERLESGSSSSWSFTPNDPEEVSDWE